MSTLTIGQWVDALMVEVRDPVPFDNSRAYMRLLLSELARLVNAGNRLVIETAPLALVPLVAPIYSISTLLPACVRVEAVTDDDRDLAKLEFRSLVNYSRTWLRDTSDRPEAWSLLGRNNLVIYPVAVAPRTVVVRYTKLLADVSSDDALVPELRDEDMNAVMDLAEALLMAKLRKLDNIAGLIEQMRENLTLTSQGRGMRAATPTPVARV